MRYVKSFWLIIVCILILFLGSCNFSTNKNFSYMSETNSVVYNNEVYYLSEYSYGDFYWNDNDVVKLSTVLGHIFYGPFEYYGNSYESPNFIVSVHGYKTRSNIWFLEKDFKYEDQVFIIENTNYKMNVSDCYIPSSCIDGYCNQYKEYEVANFKWYLYKAPELYDKIYIYDINNIYYIGGISDTIYQCTSEFVEILYSVAILNNE